MAKRLILLLFAALLLLAGCGGKAEIAELSPEINLTPTPTPHPIIGKWALEGLDVVYEFNTDGSVTVISDTGSVDFSFTVSGDKLIIDGENGKTENTFVISGTQLELVSEKGDTYRFTRVEQ